MKNLIALLVLSLTFMSIPASASVLWTGKFEKLNTERRGLARAFHDANGDVGVMAVWSATEDDSKNYTSDFKRIGNTICKYNGKPVKVSVNCAIEEGEFLMCTYRPVSESGQAYLLNAMITSEFIDNGYTKMPVSDFSDWYDTLKAAI